MKISGESKKKKDESFGLRFRLLMGYHDLTLKDIAVATQNAVSTVSTWKNGRIPSSFQTIERLAKQFKVTPSFLLHGHREYPPKRNLANMSLSGRVEEREKEEYPSQSSVLLADKIITYVQAYIQKASAFPYILEHLWVQVQKEFALDNIPSNSEKFAHFFRKN
jgi:transcriptional regulator with XRE-family HTH domain